jgi:hypothetical protein
MIFKRVCSFFSFFSVNLRLLVHVVKLALPFAFADEDSNDAASHHPFPVDPRVHFHEQLSSISAGGFHQFWLAAGVEGQIRRDVVHFALVAGPGWFALAASHALELRRRDSLQRRYTC